MPAITKNELSVNSLDSFKERIISLPSYFFLSGQSPWPDEQNPPDPKDTTDGENSALNDVLGLKRIFREDTISVLPRVDWVTGTVYDHYKQDTSIINPSTGSRYTFYVLNSTLDVYKCLSNAYGSQSTVEPTGTTPESFRTPDGYIWKYMYTISSIDASKFMTSKWMPCYTLTYNDGSSQWNSQQSAFPGTIDDVVVTHHGANYDDTNPPVVTIDGDGDGAEAIAEVNSQTGEIDNIIVTSNGQGYTQANVIITDSSGIGVGADGYTIVGPRHGHGHDPRVELGGSYLMIKTVINGDEGGTFAVNTTYRTTGVLNLPLNDNLSGYKFKIENGKSRLYQVGETVSGATSSATGTVALVDYDNDILFINNVVGQFSQNESISSQTYNSALLESVESSNTPLTSQVHSYMDAEPNTGSLLYVSNREYVTRQVGQIEDIIAIISF